MFYQSFIAAGMALPFVLGLAFYLEWRDTRGMRRAYKRFMSRRPKGWGIIDT